MLESAIKGKIRDSFYTRLSTTIALFLSYTHWLGSKSSWERIAILIPACTAFLYVCIYRPKTASRSDIELFDRFNLDYSYISWGRFLESHDFGASFSNDDVEIIRKIANTVRPDPLMHFSSKVIERKYSKFLSELAEFSAQLSMRSGPIESAPGTSLYRVPKPYPWTAEGEARFEDSREKLNNMANSVVNLYREFVTTAKRELQ